MEVRVRCVACGQELPQDAGFCWRCGKPVATGATPPGSPGWEYRESRATFPPNATPWHSFVASRPPNDLPIPAVALSLIDGTVGSLVRQMREEGWEPTEPVDAVSMWKAKRVEFRVNRRGSLWALATFQARVDLVLTAVNVRFRRAAAPVAGSAGTADRRPQTPAG